MGSLRRTKPHAVVTLPRRLGVLGGRVYHAKFPTNNLSRGLDGGHPHQSMPKVRVRQAPAGRDLFDGTDKSWRRHICPAGVPTGMGPGVAQPRVALDTTGPQVSSQLPGRSSPPSGSHHGVQALVAAVPEGRPRQEMDGASTPGGLRQPRGSRSTRPAFPHLRSYLWHGITMRVFTLFRGIGLARTHRSLRNQGGYALAIPGAKGDWPTSFPLLTQFLRLTFAQYGLWTSALPSPPTMPVAGYWPHWQSRVPRCMQTG